MANSSGDLEGLPEQANSVHDPASQAMKQLIQTWIDCDLEATLDLFADNGRYEDPSLPLMADREAMRRVLGPEYLRLASVAVEVRHHLSTGIVAIAEAIFSAKLKDGATTLFPFVLVLELRDGKIQRLAEYFDPAQWPTG